jgi:protein required for attachment to host cells
MKPLKIPHGGWILVADARKALLLYNEGDPTYPNFRTLQTIEAPDNPATSAQGADRPGRTMSGDRKSAVGQTDWHDQAEAEFAVRVVETVFKSAPPVPVVLVAPPAFLAELRKHIPEQAREKVVAEIAKDLTKLPVGEIEKHLTG